MKSSATGPLAWSKKKERLDAEKRASQKIGEVKQKQWVVVYHSISL